MYQFALAVSTNDSTKNSDGVLLLLPYKSNALPRHAAEGIV
jgi:hypothetical protein